MKPRLPVLIGAEGEVQPFPTLSAAEGAASARKARCELAEAEGQRVTIYNHAQAKPAEQKARHAVSICAFSCPVP